MSEEFDFEEALATALPPLYAAILKIQTRLLSESNDGVDARQIGNAAWESLTFVERIEAMPQLLGAYVHVVYEEERLKRLQQRAEDSAHTYLEDSDVSVLWDSALGVPDEDGEVAADRRALLNVLCELELLTHRLAMRESSETGGA